jgi:hypothetical protein
MENNSTAPNGIAQVRIEARLRWIAAGTGLVTMSGLAITVLYLPFPILLIVGAAIAGKWLRTGRWLMWIGASVISVCVLPFYVLELPVLMRSFFVPDVPIMLINIGWMGTMILLPLCDVMLILDGFRGRKMLAKTAV